MGRLFDEFGALTFQNEAAVSQNFILPLLQRYLGYRSEEIIPEVHYPAKDIFSGVHFAGGGSKGLVHRPDYVVCLNGNPDEARFVIDSKGPGEKIDDHLGQLHSYALSVGKNLLMMTNGKEVKVYNVNEILFYSQDIADLQIRIDELVAILGRSSQSSKSTLEILKDINFERAISESDQERLDRELQQRKILLADFHAYLKKLTVDFAQWYLPSQYFQALDDLQLTGMNPSYLHTFQLQDGKEEKYQKKKQFKLHNVQDEAKLKIKVFVGETGTGKTCLLKFMTLEAAKKCLAFRELRIPVYIALREISERHKLGDLITAFLSRNGYRLASLYDLPQTNEFVFYLDAYDEVPEQLRSDTYQEITYLGERYEVYITARPSIIPHFKPSMIFDLLPLSENEIKEIVKTHIGDRYYEFQQQLENGNLARESGNILLLLCLISVYKESATLPGTVAKVIGAVVSRVRKWQDSKQHKAGGLSWVAVERFLAHLAFHVVESGNIAIAKTEVEKLLLEPLLALEQERKLSLGYSTAQIIDELERTGLIMGNQDSLYFWHRVFLSYFASVGLKLRYESGTAHLEEKVPEGRWHVIIVGMSSLVSDTTDLVKSCKDNLWLAAYCLEENSQCEQNVLETIVDQLKALVVSPVPEMRNRASSTITKIENSYVLDYLFEAIEQNVSPEIKMHALSRIGKTRSEKALRLICQNLDWKEGAFFSGSASQAHIARGLYYYHEPEHLVILECWRKNNDYLMDKECGRIFLELHSQGRITETLLHNLEELFIEDFIQSEGNGSKLYQLATLLSLNQNDNFAYRLLDVIFSVDFAVFCVPLIDLLKEYTSLPVVEKLKGLILKHAEEKHYSVELLVKIIYKSKCLVPKNIYLELAGQSNKNIAYQAVAAFSRFPFETVKEEIYLHLYGNDPQMQNGALEALVENGEIIELIRTGKFPASFFTPTAHTLLRAVRQFNLYEALPILERIMLGLNKEYVYTSEFNLALELAGTLYFLGEKDKQMVIIGWYFDGRSFTSENDTLHFHLMKNLKYLAPELTVPIAISYFNAYFPLFKERGGIKMDTFLEVVEQLGNYEFVAYVKRIVESLLADKEHLAETSGYHLEHPMRTLVSLVRPDDEDWVLCQLDHFKHHESLQFPALRRALECLAVVGSATAIPFIKQIAVQFKDKEMVLNTCQIAYEHICFRLKLPLTGDLFSEQTTRAEY